MEDWKLSICATPTTVRIQDIRQFVSVHDSEDSPIDYFYKDRNNILNAISPEFSTNNQSIVPFALVGLISITENYFREIISRFISICPKAKVKSSEKSLNLATAWFGYGELEKGAFENTSFSSATTIKKNLQNLLQYNVESSNEILAPLNEFDKLCELRHAIVHSACLLAGKNAIKLELPSSEKSVKVTISYSQLQEAADICTSLVSSVNLGLFNHISKRWLNDWPRTIAYQNEDFNLLFNKIWILFFSTFDSDNHLISCPLSKIKTKNKIVSSRAS